MASRLRENVDKLFEVFFEIGQPLTPYEGPKKAREEKKGEYEPNILQKYPPDFEDKQTIKTSGQMSFPCELESSTVEHYTFTMTDAESIFKFGFCRHSPGSHTCLVIVSYLPWFEVFYKLLNHLAEITNRKANSSVMPLLDAMYNHEVPAAGAPATIVAGQEMFSFTVPDPNILPCIPGSRNLTEYYNAIDTNNMIVIFASMLNERRMIFTSKKLSRLTACVYGAAALLYPMHWQHILIPLLPGHLMDMLNAPMPFIIGVTTAQYQRYLARQNANDRDHDVIVVDADANKVQTSHSDLENLPEDVASFLKKQLRSDKLKSSMAESGDAISQAFLQTLVRLIGGYRDALKFRPNEPITFDPEAFVMSRPSAMKPFLENMLHLQIFQQFINDRLDMLNLGQGFHDIFEKKSMLYSDRLNSDHRYKEWRRNMKKQGKKLQRSGKDMFAEFKDKAAPVMSNAVQSVKYGGKKAYSGFKNKLNEFSDSSKSPSLKHEGIQESSQTRTYKSNGAAKSLSRQRPTTIVGADLKPSRPPRPPQPTHHRSQVSSGLSPKNRSRQYVPLDDTALLQMKKPVNQHLLVDMPSDLQRSCSAENIKKGGLLESDDESASSSTPPSTGAHTPAELDSDIPYVDFDANSVGSNTSHNQQEAGVDPSDIASGESFPRRPPPPVLTQPMKLPVPPPRTRSLRSSQVPPPRPQTLPTGSAAVANPPVPPRGNLIHLESSESEPDLDPFDPLAGTRLQKPVSWDSGLGDVGVLQDLSGNATSGAGSGGAGAQAVNMSFGFGDVVASRSTTAEAAVASTSETSPRFQRNESGRNSMIKRTNAFRSPTQETPKRTSSLRDKDASPENSLLDLCLDPLAASSSSSSSASAVQGGVGKESSAGVTSPNLMGDWTLDRLGMSVPTGPVQQAPPPTLPKPHNVPSAAHNNPLYFTPPPPVPKPRTSQSNPLYIQPSRPAMTSNPLYVPPSQPSGRSSEAKPDPFADLAPPELSRHAPRESRGSGAPQRKWETFN